MPLLSFGRAVKLKFANLIWHTSQYLPCLCIYFNCLVKSSIGIGLVWTVCKTPFDRPRTNSSNRKCCCNLSASQTEYYCHPDELLHSQCIMCSFLSLWLSGIQGKSITFKSMQMQCMQIRQIAEFQKRCCPVITALAFLLWFRETLKWMVHHLDGWSDKSTALPVLVFEQGASRHWSLGNFDCSKLTSCANLFCLQRQQ